MAHKWGDRSIGMYPEIIVSMKLAEKYIKRAII